MNENLGIKNGLEKSFLWHKRAEKVIPACSQLLSRGPYVHPFGAYPVYIERGNGSHVWDVDGNEYIDWVSSFGPVLLGYAHPVINNAIKKQLDKGLVFSLEGTLQVELSEILCDMIPCAEMVRFGKHGSDVTSAAVKCARSYTGREKIAYCGYHGWQDWYITVGPSKGIPKAYKDYILGFEYNNLDSLKKIFAEHPNEIACVIMEPVHNEKPKNNFLAKVKELVHKNGALFIFDEVITGFRFGCGGAQSFFNVVPDLATFGKAMANGMPISALVGKKEFMKEFSFGGVFFSSTFASELASMVSAINTLHFVAEHPVAQEIWKTGKNLQNGYNDLAKNLPPYDIKTKCVGYPPFLSITFYGSDEENSLVMKSYFLQECAKKGVLFGPCQFPNWSHSIADTEYSLEVVNSTFSQMAKIGGSHIKYHLEGDVIKTVF